MSRCRDVEKHETISVSSCELFAFCKNAKSRYSATISSLLEQYIINIDCDLSNGHRTQHGTHLRPCNRNEYTLRIFSDTDKDADSLMIVHQVTANFNMFSLRQPKWEGLASRVSSDIDTAFGETFSWWQHKHYVFNLTTNLYISIIYHIYHIY